MASYQKRGKNSYLLVVEVGYGGQRKKETTTIRIEEKLTPTKLEERIQEELLKFKMEVESGHYIKPGRMTVKAFTEIWEKRYLEKLAEKTIQNYKMYLKKYILPKFEDMYIEQVTTMHLVDFFGDLEEQLKEKNVSNHTLIFIHRVLRSIFTKAREWNIIKYNPLSNIKKPPEPALQEVNVYDEEEAAALFQALNDETFQFRMFISLALTTGMRRGEILGLEWSDIDLKNGIIRVSKSISSTRNGLPVVKEPKTKRIRRISIPESLIEETAKYKKEWMKEKSELMMSRDWLANEKDEFLFHNGTGLPYHPNTFTKMWRSFHDQNKLNIRYIPLKDLRHTSATLLLNQGVHAKIISERLGHSKIDITMNRYSHVIEKVDRAAANLFDKILAK